MITPNRIFTALKCQAPHISEAFSQDGPIPPMPKDDPDYKYWVHFHNIVMVENSEELTEKVQGEIHGQKVSLEDMAISSSVSDYVTQMYRQLKRQIEVYVGRNLKERGVTHVIGNSRSELYGKCRIVSDNLVFQFVSQINLTCVKCCQLA